MHQNILEHFSVWIFHCVYHLFYICVVIFFKKLFMFCGPNDCADCKFHFLLYWADFCCFCRKGEPCKMCSCFKQEDDKLKSNIWNLRIDKFFGIWVHVCSDLMAFGGWDSVVRSSQEAGLHKVTTSWKLTASRDPSAEKQQHPGTRPW